MKYEELIPSVHWNCSPYDNTNLLILGNSKDLQIYLPDLKSSIWDNFTDITIWEPQSIITSISKLEGELDTIDMAVVLVTNSFLDEYNIASEIILPKVLSKGLTILPILLDEDLAQLFCSKYGNLHMSKCHKSASEIARELLKFSSNIPKKKKSHYSLSFQRNPFTLSLFISYRKKDGKYIDMLQNYIHRDSSLWSTQLWYDSYLVPGKNYDEFLKNMIDKCDAMLLIVTPQLFEKDNYVLTTELPYALRRKKVIIPIQMEPIPIAVIELYTNSQYKTGILNKDKREVDSFLSDLFSKGELFNLEDYNSFSDIINKVEGITLSDKLASDQNTNMFEIAMKYLKGDTVEQNIELAKDLLLKCAQNGDISAYDVIFEKFTGNSLSTAFSYEIISMLYRNYIGIFEARFNSLGTRQNKEALFEAIRKYGEYCHRKNRLDDAYSLFKDAYSLVKDDIQDEVNKSWTYVSVACLNIGRVAEEKGLFEEAEQFYRKAVDIDMTIYNDEDMSNCNPVTQRNLLISLYELGYYYNARKKYLNAVIQYLEILSTLDNYGFMYGTPWDADTVFNGYENAESAKAALEYKSLATWQLTSLTLRYNEFGLYHPQINKYPRSYVTDVNLLADSKDDEIALLSHEIMLNTISKQKWLHDFLAQYEYDFDLCQYQYCVDAKVLMAAMSFDLLHTCTLIIHANISTAETLMKKIVEKLNCFWDY